MESEIRPRTGNEVRARKERKPHLAGMFRKLKPWRKGLHKSRLLKEHGLSVPKGPLSF